MSGHPHHLPRGFHRGIELHDFCVTRIGIVLLQSRGDGIGLWLSQLPQFSEAEFGFILGSWLDLYFEDSAADFFSSLARCARACVSRRKWTIAKFIIFSRRKPFWGASERSGPGDRSQLCPLFPFVAVRKSYEILAQLNSDPALQAKVDAAMVLLVRFAFFDRGAVQPTEWGRRDLSRATPAVFVPDQ